ncbi:SDR family NAD(P)-dependent oxidoreductase [Nocardioides sp. URHA0020]|uniref:SDR family NAD(P)-dependent oxidoreductase n=1 Tax=Nocardioides sp. URHA0020 TaxID=1380392 RepID=UPI00048D40F9|nr:SDR family NAD(P)-dependent oxidoreductase [Nocardioides sp. URHA0020]
MPSLARLIDTAMDRTVAPGYTRLGPAVRRRLSTWPADPPTDALAGRRALVTGASSGLGAATAEGLAALGAEVVLVVRDTDKGAAVVREIQGRRPLARLDVQRCDLADLDDVRRFVAADSADVDVLVHNAGAMPPTRTESPQGHEMTMALHVLSPVLMTELLGDRLRDGRVVMVTSGGMYTQRLREDDPEFVTGKYSGTTAYARSKRAQIELLPILQRRWQPRGVDVHATHPGWADTPGVAESLPTFRKITGPLLRDAAEGADTTVWISATQPPPAGGRLWHDRQPRPTQLLRRTRTGDAERDRMWSWVQELLGL